MPCPCTTPREDPEPETCVSGATLERHFHGECACGEPGFEELLPAAKDEEADDE